MPRVDKLERLLNLIAALLDAVGPLSAQEIRVRVPGYPDGDQAFHRQFERDKEEIRSLGIPLRIESIPYTDPPESGYRIRKSEYQMKNPNLAPDEIAALQLATSFVRLAGITEDSAFWRLGGDSSAAMGEPGASVSVEGALPRPAALPLLYSAIATRTPLRFEYRGEDREVEPVALHFELGHWYLRAFDRGRGDFRSFRLDRTEGGVQTVEGQNFAPREDRDVRIPQPWEIGDEEPVEALVRIAPKLASWVSRALGPDLIAEHLDDGGVTLAILVVNRAEFFAFVLGFLEHAEVLGPASLREEMTNLLEDLMAPDSTLPSVPVQG